MEGPATGSEKRRLPILAQPRGDAVSLTGTAPASMALPWFVLETTGSSAKTGPTFAAITLGNVLTGFFRGPVPRRETKISGVELSISWLAVRPMYVTIR